MRAVDAAGNLSAYSGGRQRNDGRAGGRCADRELHGDASLGYRAAHRELHEHVEWNHRHLRLGLWRRHDEHGGESEQGLQRARHLHRGPDGDGSGRIEHHHEGQPDHGLADADADRAGGLLSGTVASGTGTIDLTAAGTSDWVQWPTNARKATGNGRIGNYSLVGASGSGTFASDRRAMKWTDGSPIASGTSSEGVSASGGVGKGFQIVVPADGTTRTLVVYVGTASSTGKLTARLSDGSAPDFVRSTGTKFSKTWDGYYTLTYRAASAGQTLKVQWTVDSARRWSSSGAVRMQGAALK